MSFAASIRSRGSQRLLAVMTAGVLVASLMAVFAPPAWAHNGTVSWDCDGWSVNLNNYVRSGTNQVTVTVDGNVVASQSSNWGSFSTSGTWDDTQTHTLVVDVIAWDDPTQTSHTLGSNSSFSPDWQHGEWSFKLNITQDACTQPPPEEVSVTVGGECVVEEGAGVGLISVEISVPNGASVDVSDSGGVLQNFTQSGTLEVDVDASYSWSATAMPGYTLTGSPSGSFDIDDCTPPPVVGAAVTVGVTGGCDVVNDLGQGTIDVTVSVAGGATVVITDSNGATEGTFTEDGSIMVPVGDTYTWTATAGDGFEFPEGFVTSGELPIGDCTPLPPPVVGASILVTVGGTCVVDDGDGSGVISVTISVANGATVVVSDSNGAVVGTFSSDGSVTVPEGATYSWSATASEGFEFPSGFVPSGTVTVGTCSTPTVLPFTGIYTDQLAAIGFVLLAAGVLVMTGGWYLLGWSKES